MREGYAAARAKRGGDQVQAAETSGAKTALPFHLRIAGQAMRRQQNIKEFLWRLAKSAFQSVQQGARWHHLMPMTEGGIAILRHLMHQINLPGEVFAHRRFHPVIPVIGAEIEISAIRINWITPIRFQRQPRRAPRLGAECYTFCNLASARSGFGENSPMIVDMIGGI